MCLLVSGIVLGYSESPIVVLSGTLPLNAFVVIGNIFHEGLASHAKKLNSRIWSVATTFNQLNLHTRIYRDLLVDIKSLSAGKGKHFYSMSP